MLKLQQEQLNCLTETLARLQINPQGNHSSYRGPVICRGVSSLATLPGSAEGNVPLRHLLGLLPCRFLGGILLSIWETSTHRTAEPKFEGRRHRLTS